MYVNQEERRVYFRYPLLKLPDCLTDNRKQAIGIARRTEARLDKKGQMEDYNLALQDFLNRGIMREIPGEEMTKWSEPINYIAHQEAIKTKSATTKLRVVSNSSLSNNNSGWSYNSILPKGPNSLVPLLAAVIT